MILYLITAVVFGLFVGKFLQEKRDGTSLVITSYAVSIVSMLLLLAPLYYFRLMQ